MLANGLNRHSCETKNSHKVNQITYICWISFEINIIHFEKNDALRRIEYCSETLFRFVIRQRSLIDLIITYIDGPERLWFNPLTPRCAEFSCWVQCRTIYRNKMKKDRKHHTLPFLGSLFRMAESEFSKNDAKPFIFPKKRYFWGTIFF